MLTIYGIDKLKINTIIIGNKQTGPNEYWSIKDVIEGDEYYHIRMKCTQCMPASGILGTERLVVLNRRGMDSLGQRIYELEDVRSMTRNYVMLDSLKAPRRFVQELLKLLSC
jgi:hypothetical protein